MAVYAALIGNVLVALTKAAAAAWTGSSAMLSEAVHSFVDTGNEILLLYGLRRSARDPDPEHPLGHGRELYFWSFIVALLVFALGAGVSLYEGVMHIRRPEPITDPLVNYVVLGLAFLFEGASWLVSWRQFRVAKGPLGVYQAFRRSKDPPSFMVLFEDSAALLGILIAAVGTFASVQLQAPVLDGVASILIGLVLAGVAALLARESKSLLIGERADRELSESILHIAREISPASQVNGIMTIHLAPEQIVAALSVDFADDLRAYQIEEQVLEMERRIQAAHPEVVTLFIKPQTDRVFKVRRQQRLDGEQ
ncbi:MAG TPA: cation diffusion facilitator family transporter [Gammaproteobacteria bacterium]|nr:cation diffusion facilitator family transporter [Gammaproteobacteria bacterium]